MIGGRSQLALALWPSRVSNRGGCAGSCGPHHCDSAPRQCPGPIGPGRYLAFGPFSAQAACQTVRTVLALTHFLWNMDLTHRKTSPVRPDWVTLAETGPIVKPRCCLAQCRLSHPVRPAVRPKRLAGARGDTASLCQRSPRGERCIAPTRRGIPQEPLLAPRARSGYTGIAATRRALLPRAGRSGSSALGGRCRSILEPAHR